MSDTQNSTNQTLNQNPAPVQNEPKNTPTEQTKPSIEINNTEANTNIAFKASAIGVRENAHNKDYFAEQNQAAQTKKQNQHVLTKKTLTILCIVGGAIIVGGGILWIVSVVTRPQDVIIASPEEIKSITETTYDEAISKAGINDPDVETGEAEENIDAATETFDQAIKNAEDSGEEIAANNLLVSQMEFYFYETDDFEKIIQLSNKVNLELLDDDELARYYNCLANAYWGLGDMDEANKLYELIFELSGGGEYGN